MNLPPELIREIMLFLPANDLLNIMKVSHKFENINVLAEVAYFSFGHDLQRFKLFTKLISEQSLQDLVNHSNRIIKMMAYRILISCNEKYELLHQHIISAEAYFHYLTWEHNYNQTCIYCSKRALFLSNYCYGHNHCDYRYRRRLKIDNFKIFETLELKHYPSKYYWRYDVLVDGKLLVDMPVEEYHEFGFRKDLIDLYTLLNSF